MGGCFPRWIRRPLAVQGRWDSSKRLVEELNLNTVCEEARCPNLGECWSRGSVSFMILGDRCTRRCGFCAVSTARPGPVDPEESQRLAEAVRRLGLNYVVVTSVARDDLADGGSSAFADCVQAVRRVCPSVQVEVLTPDFHARPDQIGRVISARPCVYSHNVETIERLSPEVRPQASYRRSLEALRLAKDLGGGGVRIKSGMMMGLGEQPEEVRRTLEDLRQAGCEILTLGQYLRPTLDHRPVSAFVPPDQFELYRRWGEEMGFFFVASAPHVRSSYNAFKAFQQENV